MKYVTYCRVSTAKQGESGLGLEAQRSTVTSYANSSNGRVIAEYVEVESGTHCDRPQLTKALAHARQSKATLVVAKLDRLARNVAFLSTLMESGVQFVACDNPSATKLTLHILVAVAENEVEMIRARTRAALAAAKARGTLLGSARPGHWQGREQCRLEGAAKGNVASATVRSMRAEQAHAEIFPIVKALRDEGLTLRQIAVRLNAEGRGTRRGKLWTPAHVYTVLKHACVSA
jgi:DNA invertase Pin-like site-specific DNA recombinase